MTRIRESSHHHSAVRNTVCCMPGPSREEFEKLLLESAQRPRFTQDSPVYADVWLSYYGRPPDERQDLLLEPHHRAPVGTLAKAVHERLGTVQITHRMAYAGEYVAVELTRAELLRDVLPLSKWWRDLTRPAYGPVFDHLRSFAAGHELSPDPEGPPQAVPPSVDELKWWLRVSAALLTAAEEPQLRSDDLDTLRGLTTDVLAALGDPSDANLPERRPLWSVSINRPVKAAVWRSRQTVKADAANRVFPPDLEGLAWAVVDSGVDATHPAFLRRDEDGRLPELADGDFDAQTIVRRTYDFTGLRDQIAAALAGQPGGGARAKAIEAALKDGLAVDWGLYEPLIRIEHRRPGYKEPVDPHGTHVAGTIAGDWRLGDRGAPTHPLEGICPGLELYDLRVLDDTGDGREFGVLAALSFVRWRNSQSGGTVIHGVNLSFSLEHDVRKSACGRSPVCLEAERVHNAGVVVVAAAGNEGRAEFTLETQRSEGYRTVSITDPGNTEVAITVGSTHRIEPHAYGVSYFSSRGPTGDGRAKPDLVAPGEKITAPVPGEKSARMDGTSMAAPHVSGAAALLMARHRELVGRPAEVKRVLCESATDLGRERHYQGHGMLDILRAIESV
jgi:serine protease AprX